LLGAALLLAAGAGAGFVAYATIVTAISKIRSLCERKSKS